ncbi:hypothetical protein MIR68_006530 [Amoeboaphelidium protococcarum]|nr:hypothetical protein MIR68_006530 [Amoeboaphelidium protococcarum]
MLRMQLIRLCLFVMLFMLLSTLAMPPKSKKKGASSQHKQSRHHSHEGTAKNEQEEDLNIDAFRYMASDDPLLATYNPDYINDAVMQKLVLDGYLYTHEYLISQLNYIKPQIKHANEFYHSILVRWMTLQQDFSDAEFVYAMQHEMAANLLQDSLNLPTVLLQMSFFDNALQTLLDGRLSKAHIYNIVVNLISVLSTSQSEAESGNGFLRRIQDTLIKQYSSLSAQQRQKAESKRLKAFIKVIGMQYEASEKLIEVIRGIQLFDIDDVRRSIRKTISTLRGEGTSNSASCQFFLFLGEPFIGYLQLYQVLYPIVSQNDKFVQQLRGVHRKSRLLSLQHTSQSQLSAQLDNPDVGKFLNQHRTTDSSKLLANINRMTADFIDQTRQVHYMQKMIEVSQSRFSLNPDPIASVILQGHRIYKEYSQIAMPMIGQLVQVNRLREADIPHEFSPEQRLQLHCPSASADQRESPLPCQSQSDILSSLVSKVDIYESADLGDESEGGVPVSNGKSNFVIDPYYKNEVDFDIKSDSEDGEVQPLNDQRLSLPPSTSSSHNLDSSQQLVVPQINGRKEICSGWKNYDKYQFLMSDLLMSLEYAIFTPEQLFTLCQITDGATKGGYNVKYSEFLSLLSEFNAIITPLTGSITRITVPMKGTHPLSIHGPHSGNVELGRRVIKGAKRVLNYYEILPENFQPLHG